MSIGVPIKVLHEAEGHTVTVETMLGEVYRGKLLEAEDNMNVQVGIVLFRRLSTYHHFTAISPCMYIRMCWLMAVLQATQSL